ncbi:aminoacyl-histidine dipeptidase [Candidatus Sulfidibacterium hydrothermale]|uniref:aminoacyl-histidine dipeptidase n=1 Tax=Candidatus Sulfidibacterium hydrothermale TaxID=2875962 RepID=UPI001F0B20F7|nr:aminoacyl-histidine dipeptidase [Candidatus Sulfidibacterium hydrothermale]UBM62050.1 aminoacyl-histidine dipeptidase [Candidatus Sulfidibacterium hydrothermale]
MSKEILNLEPKALWKNFYSLTQIPRPSKKEEKVIEFLKKFGEDLGLETIVDEVGNVIIKKPATEGMENRKGIILQGHIDMVPQKNSDVDHDFEKDPIEAYIDGEWVTAKGTTLGADNGIGVAAAMTVLEAKDLQHGPVEALFTIDEETGMTGAEGLKPGLLDGDILLNLDSEDEGELYIGCAGGVNTNGEMEYKEEDVPEGTAAYKVAVKGLKGGHSGLDINLGRGNANKIINALLVTAAEKFGLRVAEVEGGNLRNAIPREAFAVVVVPEDKKADFEKFVKEFDQLVKDEFAKTDEGVEVTAETTEKPAKVMEEKAQNALFKAVADCPNGAIAMSKELEGIVETSTNLAIVKAKDGKMELATLQRSLTEDGKDKLAADVRAAFEGAGLKAESSGDYPGWKPNPDSIILKEMKEIYEKKFGKVPEVKVIHAGLECGLLGSVYPNWDMISFGPTIRWPHSPDEKVNIATVQKFWDYLVETLKNVPEK